MKRIRIDLMRICAALCVALLSLCMSLDSYAQDTVKITPNGLRLTGGSTQTIQVEASTGEGRRLNILAGNGVGKGGDVQLLAGSGSDPGGSGLSVGGDVALGGGAGDVPGDLLFFPGQTFTAKMMTSSFRIGGTFSEIPQATFDLKTIGSEDVTMRVRASDGDDIMRLLNNGALGLGQPNPFATLDIKAHGAFPFRIRAQDNDELIRLVDDGADNGRIGFGTTNPLFKMHIAGGDMALDLLPAETSNINRRIIMTGARSFGGGAFAQIEFRNKDSNNGSLVYQGASIASFNTSNINSADLRFFTKDASDPILDQRMSITPNGRVVIGKQIPGATLDVQTVAGGAVTMRARNVSGSDLFKLDNDGKVEITGNLQVKGSADLSAAGQSYVAVFENTDRTDEGSDGIAIKIGQSGNGNGSYHTNGGNDYITFVNGKNEATGAIEGFDIALDNPASSFPAEPFTNFFGIFNFENAFTLPSANWSNLITYTEPTLSINWTLFTFEFDPGGLSFNTSAFNPGGFNATAFFNPTAAAGAATAVANVVCWGLSNDMESLITTNPFDAILATTIITQTNLCKENGGKGGITFVSFGADYAEWLLREDESEVIRNGQIVGVKNGKISKVTEGADQILAISTNPIVLGNKPIEGQEDRYEKVGFMGQVPVLVKGKVREGDYIVPSGMNDGIGRAVPADDLRLEDIPVILGRAWSDSENDFLSYINVAVGLNRNDIATLVMDQQKQVEKQLADLSARLDMLEQDVVQTANH